MNYELRVMRPSPTLPVREGDWATNYKLCIINLHYQLCIIMHYALCIIHYELCIILYSPRHIHRHCLYHTCVDAVKLLYLLCHDTCLLIDGVLRGYLL